MQTVCLQRQQLNSDRMDCKQCACITRIVQLRWAWWLPAVCLHRQRQPCQPWHPKQAQHAPNQAEQGVVRLFLQSGNTV